MKRSIHSMSTDKISSYGIDGINFEIIPYGSYNNISLSLKNYDGVEYVKLVPKGKKFILCICLPRAVRNNNIRPYTLCDTDTIIEIRTEILEALNEIFFDGYESKLIHAEICGTCEAVGESKCDNIFRLLINSLLHETEQNKLFVITNKKNGILPYCSGMQSRTIRNRWSLKAYDKYREMGILSDRELVRIEFCIKGRQINTTLRNSIDISSVLTQSALEKLIGLYRILFDELTEDFIRPYLKKAKNVFRQAYIENKCRPTIPYLKCREIIVDDRIMRNVFSERYKDRVPEKKNTRQDIKRIKKSHGLPHDTLETIKKLHYLDEM